MTTIYPRVCSGKRPRLKTAPVSVWLLILLTLTVTRHGASESPSRENHLSGRGRPSEENSQDARYASPLSRFQQGAKECQQRNWTIAIQLLSDPKIQSDTPLGDRALFLLGDAQLSKGLKQDAAKSWEKLLKNWPDSVLKDRTLKCLVDLYESEGLQERALGALKPRIEKGEADPAIMAASIYERQHRRDDAIALYRTVLVAHPVSTAADSAQNRLIALGAGPFDQKAMSYKKAMVAADQLYESEAYERAKWVLRALLDTYPEAQKDERIRINWLTSVYRSGDVRTTTRELAAQSFREPESQAQAVWLMAEVAKRLGQTSRFDELSRELLDRFPMSQWTAQNLNSRALLDLRRDRQDQAMQAWKDLVRLQPRSPLSSEATYRLGRHYYSVGDYANALTLFLQHLENSPSSNYLGSAVYWTGRSEERLGKIPDALVCYRRILTRYPSGYYTQRAEERIRELTRISGKPQKENPDDDRLAKIMKSIPPIQVARVETPHAAKVHQKRAALYFELALNDWGIEEIRAALDISPTSHEINLTLARSYAAAGDHLAAINAMRRAHPDYLSYPNQALDQEAWQLLFPLEEWETIKAQCQRMNLDPYLIAGLIRQESGFNLRARSRANALGLMQVLPSTGKRVARSYGFRRIGLEKFYDPEINIRLGTQYLYRLMQDFRRVEYALAAYNGGPSRVTRWLHQFGKLDLDEWVENVPITETRLYVQGVLRSAAQYRRIYGGDAP